MSAYVSEGRSTPPGDDVIFAREVLLLYTLKEFW